MENLIAGFGHTLSISASHSKDSEVKYVKKKLRFESSRRQNLANRYVSEMSNDNLDKCSNRQDFIVLDCRCQGCGVLQLSLNELSFFEPLGVIQGRL